MRLYIKKWSCWSPSSEEGSVRGPGLPYVSSLFRRRLSQISRITIQVIHDVLPYAQGSPIVFISTNGESSRQMQINRMLVQDGEILPAPFSLSVFNTPPAVASIALNITAGYSAIYPEKNLFEEGFVYGASIIFSGDADSVILVFADERLPSEYAVIADPAENTQPCGAAFVLSGTGDSGSLEIDIDPENYIPGMLFPSSDIHEFLSSMQKRMPI